MSTERAVGREWFPRFGVLFCVSFGFYLALAWKVDRHTVFTGGISAVVVAIAFATRSVGADLDPVRLLGQAGRLIRFVPVLLFEIAKANLAIAYLVLHPDLPIEPSVVEFEPTVTAPGSRLLLGIAITLTPGTVVIDVRGSAFVVHTLTPVPAKRLRDGRIASAVEYVSSGRIDAAGGGETS